jgi:DNA-binding MarR family transcriptional regulator
MKDAKISKVTETILAECIAIRVRLLSRALTAIYDDALRTFGLTINQFSTLVVVSRMGKATAKKVSKYMLMDPSTVSRNLERMPKEGWLKRMSGQDARFQELLVTEKGRLLLKRAFPAGKKLRNEPKKR